jgi:hypothetical protein
MRWACCAAITLAACYSPTFSGGAPCQLATNLCPIGQTCVSTGGGGDGVCLSDRSGAVDAGGDTTPGDASACAGMSFTSKLLGSVCLSTAPTTALSLSGSTTVNTANVPTGSCTQLVPQSGGPALCVLAGTTIDIAAGATLRAVGVNPIGSTAAGTNPLVLIATQTITISGTLDVSSHSNETVGGAPALGAGARTTAGCFATGVDGPAGSGSNGGGGGAGGSFGTVGGLGGNGGNNNNTGHGSPTAAMAPTYLVGGCPGGHGGDGAGGLISGGAGGNPGGAVYLLAGRSILVAGKLNASGAGGVGGVEGNNSSGGGGGGGAGGLIVLEAPQVSVTGAVFANGGGGGAGAGNIGDGSDNGKPGSDPATALTVAPGGGGTSGGGNGGAGAAGTTAAVAGNKGGGNAPESAGGGGGGAAGVIRVLGAPASSIGGTVSPPAT